ncbi:hypothetical protein D3C81_1432320 [compost metagenome]
MQTQFALASKLPCGLQILARQHFAVVGIFQTQEFGAGEVNIVGFDFGSDFVQRQGAVGRGINGLWLNTAEHRSATGFIQVVMGTLADDILFAAFAVAQQRHQVRLGAGWQEQRRLFTA